jgi:hypothetical protein
MILDSPPHVARIYLQETTTDSYDNVIHRPSSTFVEVACLITPMSSRRDREDSRVDNTYKLIARDAPLGVWSRVVWNDRSFSVDEVKLFDVSSGTRHIEAVLREER